MTTVTHKNHDIHFMEQTEKWCCHALDFESDSLKKVKAKIDAHSAALRRANVPALHLETNYYGGGIKLVDVNVGTLCEPPKYGHQECWIVKNKARSKVALDHIFPLTARPALEKYIEEMKAIDRAKTAAETMLKSIQPHTAATLLEEQKAKT